MAIETVSTVGHLLDKAKVIHRLPSDYKLALVMGVAQKSLRNYRDGKTLPDARVIGKICELTGDDAGLLLAQIEAERASEAHNRAQWATGRAQALERENATLAGRVAYLERVGSFGSANAPTLAAQRISAAS